MLEEIDKKTGLGPALPWAIGAVGLMAAITIYKKSKSGGQATPTTADASASEVSALRGVIGGTQAQTNSQGSTQQSGLQTSDLTTALNPLNAGINDLGTSIINLAKGVAGSNTSLTAALTAAVSKIETDINSLSTGSASLGKVMTDAVTQLESDIKANGVQIVGMQGAISTQLDKQQTSMQSSLTQLVTTLTGAMNTSQTAVNNALTGFSDKIVGQLTSIQSAVDGNKTQSHNDAAFNAGTMWVNACMHQWTESCGATKSAAANCPGGFQSAHDGNPAAILCVGQKLLAGITGGNAGGSPIGQ